MILSVKLHPDLHAKGRDFSFSCQFKSSARVALVAMREADFFTTLYPLWRQLSWVDPDLCWFGWASEFERFPHSHLFDVAVFTDHQFAPVVAARKKIIVGHGLMVSKNYTFTYNKQTVASVESEYARTVQRTPHDVDHIVTCSPYAHPLYLDNGVPESKLVPLGYLESDWYGHAPFQQAPDKNSYLVAPTWNLEFRGYLEYLPQLLERARSERAKVYLKRHPADTWIFKNLPNMPDLHLVDPRISLVSLLPYVKTFVTDASSAMVLALHRPEMEIWLHTDPMREHAHHWWYDPKGFEHTVRDFGIEFGDTIPSTVSTKKMLRRKQELKELIYGDSVKEVTVSSRVAELIHSCLT